MRCSKSQTDIYNGLHNVAEILADSKLTIILSYLFVFLNVWILQKTQHKNMQTSDISVYKFSLALGL